MSRTRTRSATLSVFQVVYTFSRFSDDIFTSLDLWKKNRLKSQPPTLLGSAMTIFRLHQHKQILCKLSFVQKTNCNSIFSIHFPLCQCRRRFKIFTCAWDDEDYDKCGGLQSTVTLVWGKFKDGKSLFCINDKWISMISRSTWNFKRSPTLQF